MSFWEKVTGGAAAPPSPRPQGFPQPQQFQQFQQPVYPQIPQGYPQALPVYAEDPAIEAAKRKAQSSRSTMTCPDCGSDHIFKTSANVMEQCYNCGWNPRFNHSTAGAGMPSGSDAGPVHASRQISTANNFNPQQIVATIK